MMIIGLAALLLAATAGVTHAQEVTTPYPVVVVCGPSADPQVCEPPFTASVTTAGTLVAEFTTSPTHCSDIAVRFFVDGAPVTELSERLGPGDSTGEVDLGPVSPGTHTVGVQAVGFEGGCNRGRLATWAGTLEVTTSTLVGPPRTKGECTHGGWRTFNNPVFKNQGDCVSFVATGGRNPGQ
jgi:hypothetical protein